jgi:membrane associated rhomboid family serine protease
MLTYLLIGVNAIISYMAYRAFEQNDRIDRFLFRPFQLARGRNYPGVLLSNFSHANFFHFLFNMMTLYYFGPVVEAVGGLFGLLIVYVLSGVASTAYSFYRHKEEMAYQALGASGCISGVLLASTVIYPSMGIYFFFIPIAIPAPIFSVLYLLISYFFMENGGGNVAHDAHLGGALAGFILGGMIAPNGYQEFFNFFAKIFN